MSVFLEPIDPLAVLAADGDCTETPRAPRIRIDAEARLHVGAEHLVVPTADISLGGIKLALAEPGHAGTPARITIDGLPTLTGLCAGKARRMPASPSSNHSTRHALGLAGVAAGGAAG